MANEETNKFSSNLKVPPLKIVLSVHQNNTVVNMGSLEEEDSLKSNIRDDNSNDHTNYESGRRNGSIDGADSSAGDGSVKQHRKNSKTNSTDLGNDNLNNESNQLSTTRTTTVYSSSSSSSSSSDRSNSTTPSSESESLASNSTIISEHHLSQQQQQVKNKADTKDDTSVGGGAGSGASSNKQERSSRIGSKGAASEKSSDKTSNRRAQDGGNADNCGDPTASTNTASHCSKEQSLNANQRITRSSQRAAQQNKMENSGDQTGEDLNITDNHEKALESVRKVKRRKGEIQEAEQDASQSAQQLTIAMANIYPADYQIPSQNSFELYRDIRKRPYKKLMKLNHIQPKAPHGFKDYLINGGPYLLDGNKLGAGLSGPRLDSFSINQGSKLVTNPSSRLPTTPKMRYTNPQKRVLLNPSNQRHTSYTIPMISEAPRALQVGSPLYELFQDQERARHQMRMQHLKERERAIMAAEQEILRAYSRAAIANNKQKLHLSACTYFYYQERYHYIDEKSGSNGQKESKEVPHSQDNSFLCIEGGESATKIADNNGVPSKDSKNSSTDKSRKGDNKCPKDEKKASTSSSEGHQTKDQYVKQQEVAKDAVAADLDKLEESTNGDKSKNVQAETNGSNQNATTCTDEDVIGTKASKYSSTSADTEEGEGVAESSNKNDDQVKKDRLDSNDINAEESGVDAKAILKDETVSEENLKVLNKEVFITQLQDIDDKWDKIKRDMLVRHKNEADSLYAVQTLEWEWKAKEIGVCDVRVSLKVEPEFVPRVDVAVLDY